MDNMLSFLPRSQGGDGGGGGGDRLPSESPLHELGGTVLVQSTMEEGTGTRQDPNVLVPIQDLGLRI